MPGKMTEQPDVWRLVLPYVQKPIPAPLSSPARTALIQPEISALARTSRYLKLLVEPLLYTHVVTAKAALFFRDADTPSKQRLFALTKSLRFEYGPPYEPSYPILLETGAKSWLRCGNSAEEVEAKQLKQCGREIRELSASMEWVQRDPDMVARLFPQLETVSIASIYGKEDNRWRKYDTFLRRDYSKVWAYQEGKGRFDQFLHHLPNLKHLCIRNPNGPMTIPQSTYASHVPLCRYSRTVHYPPDVDEVFLPFGAKIRWTSDATSDMPWQTVIWNISNCISKIVHDRRSKALVDPRPAAPTDIANVTLYCGTSWYAEEPLSPEVISQIPGLKPPYVLPAHTMSQELQRKNARDMSAATQVMFREQSGLKDIFEWRIAAETPICSACGSGPPE